MPFQHFNPRSPCGERRPIVLSRYPAFAFQSTLPVWGATTPLTRSSEVRNISIHAPRVGSDTVEAGPQETAVISIHAPRVGSDDPQRDCLGLAKAFQSTLPVWGATRLVTRVCGPANHFNPRSPCGERPNRRSAGTIKRCNFNPRSPCGERPLVRIQSLGPINFNPRSPCGERPPPHGSKSARGHFNPRSPCGERHKRFYFVNLSEDFNPRSPCGERPKRSSLIPLQ